MSHAASTAAAVLLLLVILVILVCAAWPRCGRAHGGRARFHPGYGVGAMRYMGVPFSACASCRESDGCGPRACPTDGTIWTDNWFNYNSYENFTLAPVVPSAAKTGGSLQPFSPLKVFYPYACAGDKNWSAAAALQAQALAYVEAADPPGLDSRTR